MLPPANLPRSPKRLIIVAGATAFSLILITLLNSVSRATIFGSLHLFIMTG